MGSTSMDEKSGTSVDVVVVGAGISGVNAGYRLQTELPHLSYTILEARDAMGGTWDFFRYPGIRSDSDLHTFGFAWRPWTAAQAIADGKSIVSYIRDSAEKYGIDKKIQYHHKLLSADWSTDRQAWRLTVEANGKQKFYHAKFLLMSTGYYDYEEALPATVTGIDKFKGQVVHPQFWPEDLDYANKNMVIIGSGATAITLLPNLTEKAKHVTMLQRSPSYIVSLPQPDPKKSWLHKLLPAYMVHRINRLSFLFIPFMFFTFCQTFPNLARKVLRRRTIRQLPKDVPHDPHFNPSYNPWDQRLCLCPDGDFYKCLHEGKASVATGHIKTMTDKTIILENGSEIDADIIITATGLKMRLVGGCDFSIDGEPLKFGEKFVWKGTMLQDLPNTAMLIGYTNASWTLGTDASARHMCRLLKYMEKNKITSCIPRVEDKSMHEVPLLSLNSTYVEKARARGVLPRAGDRGPWQPKTNYFRDLFNAKYGNLTEGLELHQASL